jgi:hypothetical protein
VFINKRCDFLQSCRSTSIVSKVVVVAVSICAPFEKIVKKLNFVV